MLKKTKVKKAKAALSAANHQTLCCCPAVCSVTSYLRYLCKLSVCLAALVCRLHSNLIVIHKGPVHSELAGLQGAQRTQVRLAGFRTVFVTQWTCSVMITCQIQTERASECVYMSLQKSLFCRNEPLIFCTQQQTLRKLLFISLLQSRLCSFPVCSVVKRSFLSGQETTPGSLVKASLQDHLSIQTRARSYHLFTLRVPPPLLLTTKRSRDGI